MTVCSESVSPAVNSNWSVLSELLLGFVNLANEINKALSCLWHTLFRPIGELKLADRPRLAILKERERYLVFLKKNNLIGKLRYDETYPGVRHFKLP